MTNNRRRPRPWRGSERLEDRTLLSVSALFLDATGDLSITSYDDDTIIVREDRFQQFDLCVEANVSYPHVRKV